MIKTVTEAALAVNEKLKIKKTESKTVRVQNVLVS